MLFMPHSPGVYVALVLKGARQIEKEHLECAGDTMSDLSASDNLSVISEITSTKFDKPAHVKKIYIENHLFLDLNSLSKSFQKIMRQFQMLVIARVGSIKTCKVVAETNPYGLAEASTYFECQVDQVENMVSFEGNQFGFTSYYCGGPEPISGN